MKKLLTVMILLSYNLTFGQITLDNNYNFSGTYTKLAVSGYKFYLMDVGLAQCRIYNTNHTLWKTINLSIPASNYLYDIKLLSEGLLTSDNSLSLAYIYYFYDETTGIFTYNARVIKENGTELLSVPDCQYMEVKDLEGEGIKLLAYCYNYSVSPYTVETRIYNLPGSITGVPDNFSETSGNLPYPNPASDVITIGYLLPETAGSSEIILYTASGTEKIRYNLNPHTGSISIPVHNLEPGLYGYTIVSSGNKTTTGKFIVQ